MERIAETLRHDPALSSKILKTANSALYGQSQTISTITRALLVLGLSAVKTLALGFSLVTTLRRPEDTSFDHVGYWRRSLYTATAARTLSQHLRMARREEVFLGGLLQDLGMVAMSQALGDGYTRLVRQAGADHASLGRLEEDTFGMDHAEVGAALAERWNLPPMLVAAIRFHENPDAAEEDVLPLVRCVALGNRVAEVFLSEETGGRALELYHTQSGAWFDVGSELADQMLREIHQQTDEMARLFDLPTGNLGNAEEILARANEALMQITLHSQQRTKQLVDEVNADSLTGSLNRRAFDACVAECFSSATASRPLSVLFVDIDHFKTFNDTHGHAVGDRVLKVFAATLSAAVGDRGQVFRYGGEEFAVVCPGADVGAAVAAAEEARHAVAHEPGCVSVTTARSWVSPAASVSRLTTVARLIASHHWSRRPTTVSIPRNMRVETASARTRQDTRKCPPGSPRQCRPSRCVGRSTSCSAHCACQTWQVSHRRPIALPDSESARPCHRARRTA